MLWLGLPAGIPVHKKDKPVQVPPRLGRQIPGRKATRCGGASGAAHKKAKAGVGTVPIASASGDGDGSGKGGGSAISSKDDDK